MAPAAEAEELEEELLAAWATATTAVAATILENCIANMCLSGDGKKKSKRRGGKVSNLYSPPVAPCTVVGPCQRNAPNALPQGSPAVCRRKVFRCCLRDGQRKCGLPPRGRVGAVRGPYWAESGCGVARWARGWVSWVMVAHVVLRAVQLPRCLQERAQNENSTRPDIDSTETLSGAIFSTVARSAAGYIASTGGRIGLCAHGSTVSVAACGFTWHRGCTRHPSHCCFGRMHFPARMRAIGRSRIGGNNRHRGTAADNRTASASGLLQSLHFAHHP